VLNVASKPIVLSVVMLNVVMLSVALLNVVAPLYLCSPELACKYPTCLNEMSNKNTRA
jgi:hypothetical protein